MTSQGVPVLLYHGLWTDAAQVRGRSSAEARYWLNAQVFEEQLNCLAGGGYQAVTLDELLSQTVAGTKPIVLTFDDGWSSDWRIATPILQRLNWKAEFFVTTEWMDQPGFMTWSEVRAAAAAGMGIQSHSLTHPDLAQFPVEHVRRELVESKKILEDQLAQPVNFFALPGGSGRQAEILSLAREAQYRGVCTSQVGMNFPTHELFCWRRIPVVNTTSLSQLTSWVEGRGLTTLMWKRHAFRCMRRLFGSTLYEWSKAKFIPPTSTTNSPKSAH
jgi:peptidoglycan/xylan/chitin deacetylase (PgdA/CDA1 family)